jgi:hypothetical protein
VPYTLCRACFRQSVLCGFLLGSGRLASLLSAGASLLSAEASVCRRRLLFCRRGLLSVGGGFSSVGGGRVGGVGGAGGARGMQAACKGQAAVDFQRRRLAPLRTKACRLPTPQDPSAHTTHRPPRSCTTPAPVPPPFPHHRTFIASTSPRSETASPKANCKLKLQAVSRRQ